MHGLFALFLVAAQAPRSDALTLADAIRRAIDANRDIPIATSEIDEAEKLRKAARGGLGPIFKTDANFLVWDTPYSVNLQLPDSLKALLPPGPLPSMSVRDQLTRSFSFSVIQPLTPLYNVTQGMALYRAHGRAAESKRDTARRDIVFRAEEAFFRTLIAHRIAAIAEAAHDLVKAHHARAKSFHEAGLIHLKDVLTADVKVAQALEALLRARNDVLLAESGLQILLGLRDGERLPPLDDRVLVVAPTWKLTLDRAEKRALKSRTERTELQHRAEVARRVTRLAWGALLPTLSAVGTYQHQKGVGFQDEDQFFAGIVLSWNAWEWGAGWHKYEAARIAERRVSDYDAKLVDGIRFEVRRAFFAYRTSEASLAVALKVIPQAEEQLRLAQKRFDANATSSTEVLDAQLLLTQARTSLEMARIGTLMALAALRRAVGEKSPWEPR